jgi:hypothetical protein
MKNFLLYLLIVFTFAACQKASKIPIPDVEIKPVFYGLLEPNKQVNIVLLQSSDNKFSAIPPNLSAGARIFISDGISEIELVKKFNSNNPYLTNFGDINSSFVIQEGATYTLRAIVSGKTYTATTRVPVKSVIIDKVTYNFSKEAIDVDYIDSTLNARINFKPNSELDLNFHTGIELVKSKNSNDSLQNSIRFDVSSSLVEDTRNEAGTIITNNFTISWTSIGFSNDTTKYKFLKARVLTISPETYKFYLLATKSLFTGNSPFSEGVSTYTNINGGGLGFFGAAVESIYYEPLNY